MLDSKLPAAAETFIAAIVDDVCQLSVLSQTELLSWQAPERQARVTLETFVANCRIIDLSAIIIQRTIQLREANRIKVPDAVIAATALVNDWTLISRNDDDFKGIQGLKYLNPFTDL